MMKRKIIVCASLYILAITASSQSCLPDGIVFYTQASIDSFQVNHPGCTEIEGGVTISSGESGDIHNLSGLTVLTSIGGNLIISYNNFLGNLQGLSNITYIGGNVEIYANNLLNLSGLIGLTYVGGSIEIGSIIAWGGGGGGNPQLLSLDGLENIVSLGGRLKIEFNDVLPNLSGLENLVLTGGDLIIKNNYSLVSLSGLENLVSIGGSLEIISNISLDNLDSLVNLANINGNLVIQDNSTLSSLNGLYNLNSNSLIDLNISGNSSLSFCEIGGICEYLSDPGGKVNIYSNGPGCNNPPEIADLCGFEMSCLPYGNYYFLTQNEIDSFHEDYSECFQMEGYIYIMGDDISNLDGLSGVTSINGSLGIQYNNTLNEISGLNNLEVMTGDFSITNNPDLVNLSGFENLTAIGGSLVMHLNPELENFSAFENLASIEGGLYINYMDKLKSLEGLHKLTTIGSDFYLSNNLSLESPEDFFNLVSIGGRLVITANPVLNTLSGIDNINAESISELIITYDSLLSDCEINSVCEYLSKPDAMVYIYNNSPGCNSPEEVETACAVGLKEDIIQQPSVVSYPNPTHGIVDFRCSIFDGQWVSLKVYNAQGQEVATVLDGKWPGDQVVRWDVSNLPAGIYFYRQSTIDNRQSTIGRMIVQ